MNIMDKLQVIRASRVYNMKTRHAQELSELEREMSSLAQLLLPAQQVNTLELDRSGTEPPMFNLKLNGRLIMNHPDYVFVEGYVPAHLREIHDALARILGLPLYGVK